MAPSVAATVKQSPCAQERTRVPPVPLADDRSARRARPCCRTGSATRVRRPSALDAVRDGAVEGRVDRDRARRRRRGSRSTRAAAVPARLVRGLERQPVTRTPRWSPTQNGAEAAPPATRATSPSLTKRTTCPPLASQTMTAAVAMVGFIGERNSSGAIPDRRRQRRRRTRPCRWSSNRASRRRPGVALFARIGIDDPIAAVRRGRWLRTRSAGTRQAQRAQRAKPLRPRRAERTTARTGAT